MSETPFIDSLPPDRLEIVKQRRHPERPYYFSAASGEDVQISADMEAVLILLPASVKSDLLGVITSITIESPDEAELMEITRFNRESAYEQLHVDLATPITKLDKARVDVQLSLVAAEGIVLQQKQEKGIQTEDTEDHSAVFVTDMGRFFTAVSDAVVESSKAEILGLHDKIADALTQLSFSKDAADKRGRELSSWADIIRSYSA